MIKSILFSGLLIIAIATAPPKSVRWAGAVSNGTPGDKISFVVSPDGTTLSDLTFDGYWRCDGQPARQLVGPQHPFPIVKGRVSGAAPGPPTGGSWRFELRGDFTSQTAAAGTLRMSVAGRGCDAPPLRWTAAPGR